MVADNRALVANHTGHGIRSFGQYNLQPRNKHALH